VPDDDDRPRDASSAAGAGWSDAESVNTAWAQSTAPDDISELSRDIQAYHREQRAKRRRATLQRLSDRPGATPALIAVVALAIAALVATVLILMNPGGKSSPSELPLASTSTQVGQVGGVLPDARLRAASGGTISANALRPAAIALIPLHCNCTPLLRNLAGGASPQRLGLKVIAPTPDAEADTLSGQLGSADSAVYYDSSGNVRASVGALGVTLVLINRNGTIFSIQRNVVSESASTLSTLLQRMLLQKQASG
jgi:hypothetical protein